MNSKAATKLFSIIVLISLISCKEKPDTPANRIVRIPKLTFTKVDSSGKFETSSIKKGRPVVFMFIQSDCSHCQDEITSITKNISLTTNWRIYMISRQPLDSIRNFSIRNNLDKYSHITLLKDTGMVFYSVFLMQAIPSSVIYDKNGELRVRYEGPIDVFEMKKYIDTKGLI